jgi:hypothetical protein
MRATRRARLRSRRVYVIAVALFLLGAARAGALDTEKSLCSRAGEASELPEFFDPANPADVILLADEGEREAFALSLEDAGRNWTELAGAVSMLEDERRQDAIWLVNGMPHLDRLEMTAGTLVEHVDYAHRVLTEMPYEVPADMFRPYILTYRIEEEPVEPWRAELYGLFSPVAGEQGEIVGTARALNRMLVERLTERDSEFFGPRQSPLLTLRSGSGTGTEIAILACAALKSVGIPSRQADVQALGQEESGENWIEIFDGESWIPLYPLEPAAFGDHGHVEAEFPHNVTIVATRSAFERLLVTEEYTETGTIDLSFVRDGRPAREFEHFAISVLNRGGLVPLDQLDTVADSAGRFVATVGEGRYVVQAGVRDGHGNPFVTMREVDVLPAETAFLAFDVTPGETRKPLDPARLAGLGQILVAGVTFDLSEEPSRRMLPLIAGALSRRAPNVAVSYQSVGDDPELLATARSIIGEAELHVAPAPGDGDAPDGERAAGAEGRKPELPHIWIHHEDAGRPVFAQWGYDLNIGRAIAIAVDDYLRERLEEQ